MKNQRGSSLVSVVVSFAVLMIVLLLLQVSITASGRYAARAEEIWKQAVQAENNYVNGVKQTYTDKGHFAQVGLVMVSDSGEESWGNIFIDVTKKDPDGQTTQFYYVTQ